MKSQATGLGPAKERFLEALGRKVEDLKERLEGYLELPRIEARDDLRRRCHALSTSARVFAMHELEQTGRSAVSMLDVLRAEDREPTDDEAEFFRAMVGRLLSLASSHQSGAYRSSAIPTETTAEQTSKTTRAVAQEQYQSAGTRIEELLEGVHVDLRVLHSHDVRTHCAAIGAQHVGVLQRLRDGAPPEDLLADRSVDRSVLHSTLEALLELHALVRDEESDVDERLNDAESISTSQTLRDGEANNHEVAARAPNSGRVDAAQWVVLTLMLCAVVFVGTRSQSLSEVPVSQRPEVVAATAVVPDVSSPDDTLGPIVEVVPDTPSPNNANAASAANVALEGQPVPLAANEGELYVRAGALEVKSVRIGEHDLGSPPIRVTLPAGLHTVVFETGKGLHYRFWHVVAGKRRQVEGP